jgi:hypothetical protein
MDWKESDIAKYGRVAHEKEKNLMNVGQHTYNPETWNNGYKQQQIGKTQSLSSRTSALDDPVEFGTNTNELFKTQYQSMSYGESMKSGAKTLRSGTWNGGDFNNSVMNDSVFGSGQI